MTIRILHTADVHLDSPLQTLALRDPDLREKVQCASRDAFQRIVNMAIEQRAAAVLISGDLFDSAARSAKTAAFLIAELTRLNQENIRVFYIKGNHDAENPLTGETSLPENVHVFDGRGGKVQLEGCDVWIHGVSFSEKKAEKSLLGKFSDPVADAINIGMLHTSLNGSAAHDVYAPCTVQQLIDTGFDYWALGHIHKRQVHGNAPWIVMPGIPQGRDVGEPGPQTATIIHIDERNITTSEFPTSAIEFSTLLLDVSALQEAEELRAFAKQALDTHIASLQSTEGVVRVRLQGQNALRWQWIRDQEQWTETLNLLCRETDRLWLEKLIFDIEDTPGIVTDQSALGELSMLMSTIRQEDAFNEEAMALVEEIFALLPASERKKLLPDEHSQSELLGELSLQGEEQLMAIMKSVDDRAVSE